jgi:hypothetical protein
MMEKEIKTRMLANFTDGELSIELSRRHNAHADAIRQERALRREQARQEVLARIAELGQGQFAGVSEDDSYEIYELWRDYNEEWGNRI